MNFPNGAQTVVFGSNWFHLGGDEINHGIVERAGARRHSQVHAGVAGVVYV